MDVSCEILLQAGNRCHVISHLDRVDLFFYLKKPTTQAMKTHVTREKKKEEEKKILKPTKSGNICSYSDAWRKKLLHEAAEVTTKIMLILCSSAFQL